MQGNRVIRTASHSIRDCLLRVCLSAFAAAITFPLLGQADYATPYTFITMAGLAGAPQDTNDGIWSAARFDEPGGVAVDKAGNVYVADTGNNTIRKVVLAGTNWVVTTLAGQPGNAGTNDGTGSAARFNIPYGVAVDGTGNLYVADADGDTIRKLTLVGTNWTVTTLAGRPENSGTNDGMGSAAQFNFPCSVAVDSASNLYVADAGNDTIRKMTLVGTNWMVTTLAGQPKNPGTNDGTGSAARFNLPFGVAVDSATNLYVTDYESSTIRQVALVGTNWVVRTLAGNAENSGTNDGTGSDAQFQEPAGIAVDSATNLYVADSFNSTIRKVMPAGTNWLVTTLAGQPTFFGVNNGTGSAAQFNFPYSVAVDSATSVYVADTSNNAIRKGYPPGAVPTLSVAVGPAPGVLTLTWNTLPGYNYQMQFTTALGANNWMALGNSIVATNTSITLTNATGPDTWRFYRVVLLP